MFFFSGFFYFSPVFYFSWFFPASLSFVRKYRDLNFTYEKNIGVDPVCIYIKIRRVNFPIVPIYVYLLFRDTTKFNPVTLQFQVYDRVSNVISYFCSSGVYVYFYWFDLVVFFFPTKSIFENIILIPVNSSFVVYFRLSPPLSRTGPLVALFLLC